MVLNGRFDMYCSRSYNQETTMTTTPAMAKDLERDQRNCNCSVLLDQIHPTPDDAKDSFTLTLPVTMK